MTVSLKELKDSIDALTTAVGNQNTNLTNLINGLAGAGRTSETVKAAADAINTHLNDSTDPHIYSLKEDVNIKYKLVLSSEGGPYFEEV